MLLRGTELTHENIFATVAISLKWKCRLTGLRMNMLSLSFLEPIASSPLSLINPIRPGGGARGPDQNPLTL